MRLLKIESSFSLRAPLTRDGRPRAGPFDIREVSGEALDDSLLAISGKSASALIEPVAPGPWRAFVACDRDGVPVHHSCVAYRVGGPLLFQCRTVGAARGKGAFTQTISHIMVSLGDEGETRLDSSCAGGNLPSLRAHQRAGLKIVRTSRRPIVLGIDLKSIVRRLLRWAGG